MKRKKWLVLLLLLFMAAVACPAQAKASNVTPTPQPASLGGIYASYNGGSVKVGDQISKEDITVMGWYTDGTTEEIKDFVLPSNRVLVNGANTFIVVCSGKTANFVVYGKKATYLQAIYAGVPVSIGNSIGRENITVRVYFSDGSSEEVEDYVLGNAALGTVGTQKVSVAYSGLTADFYVPVVAAKNIVSLYVAYLGKGEVMEGCSIPESDITVTAVYSDNTTEKIYNYTMSPDKVTELGINTITVNYRGQSAAFTVDCIVKTLEGIEAEYKGGSVEVGEYVDPDDIVVTAIYGDKSREELKEFDLLGARIQVIGRNYVTVSFQGMRADIEVQGVAKVSPNYSHAASFYVKNEAKEQARVQVPLPRNLGTGTVTGRSLKASSVSRVMRKIGAQDAKYIAFEVGLEDEVMDDIFPLLMKLTLPSTYEMYTPVYILR